MELNLDDIKKALLPWDFPVVKDGQRFFTRPLLIADVAIMTNVVSRADQNVDELRNYVGGLFQGSTPPDVGKWELEELLAVITGILNYWRDRVGKNLQAVPALRGIRTAKTAIPTSMPGSSTPQS